MDDKHTMLHICFFRKKRSYDYIKDVQSCGAASQNILLCAHSLELGSRWIGEIISKSKEISELIGISVHRFELMAILTVGYKVGKEKIQIEIILKVFYYKNKILVII